MHFRSGTLWSQRLFCLTAFLLPKFLSTWSYKIPVFSTKTPYKWLLQNRTLDNKGGSSAENLILEGCTPVHLNFLIRHGAREPGAKDVKKFSALGSKVIQALKSSKEPIYHPLMDWQNRFLGHDKELVTLGREEQFELGGRIGKRYIDLLSKFNYQGLHFVVSSKSRTKDSGVAFYTGMMAELGRDMSSQEGMIISLSDETLRFFDNCEKYLTDVDNNDDALKEYSDFLKSDIMLDLAAKVSDRLGIGNVALTPAEVRVLYYLCTIETAFYNSSEWCSALKKEELHIVEYLMDLKHYWKKAYGYDINYLMSCPLTEDIFSSMSDALTKYQKGEQYVTGLFRFGHAETVLPLYAILGLFKDKQPLLADNFVLQKDRKFRSSLICPFSANIGLVVYDCKDKSERFAVSVLVNEEPVLLPTCDSLLCPLSKFQRIYSDISSCDFSEVCLNHNSETSRDEL